ncbi:hypothetical protein RUM43_006071 [Polyplax serrata]|uniref:Uncharacterized protein n=1 Tax=Polyplax serrata TaxID=468196 RepID=A0AAN8NRC7_POLSC
MIQLIDGPWKTNSITRRKGDPSEIKSLMKDVSRREMKHLKDSEVKYLGGTFLPRIPHAPSSRSPAWVSGSVPKYSSCLISTPDFAKQLHTQPTEEVLDKMKVTSEVEEFRQFPSENAV